MENKRSQFVDDVYISVRQFKVIPLVDNLKKVEDSKKLRLAVYLDMPPVPPISSTNHLPKEIKIDIINEVDDEPIILVWYNILLHSENTITNAKALWTAIYDAVEDLKRQVVEQKICDNKGNLIVVPHFLYAVEQFVPFVYPG